MYNIAIIPARSGSKRIINKNIRPLLGIPLIAWTIRPAISSQLFDHVIVSTDSFEYGELAKNFGAEIIIRDESLATDSATSIAVVLDCIEKYKLKQTDNICLLQPTSPLRTDKNIVDSYTQFIEKKADSIVSVCETEFPPLWSNTLNARLSLSRFVPIKYLKRSQDLPIYYRLNGAIYWIKVKSIIKWKRFVSIPNSFAFIMEKENSIDIDSEYDLFLAETFLKKSNEI